MLVPVHIPFLDLVVETGDILVKAMVLERPSYTVSYVAILGDDGVYWVTHRGTGRYSDFHETPMLDPVEVQRTLGILERRYNLTGKQVSLDVEYYTNMELAIRRLLELDDDL